MNFTFIMPVAVRVKRPDALAIPKSTTLPTRSSNHNVVRADISMNDVEWLPRHVGGVMCMIEALCCIVYVCAATAWDGFFLVGFNLQATRSLPECIPSLSNRHLPIRPLREWKRCWDD